MVRHLCIFPIIVFALLFAAAQPLHAQTEAEAVEVTSESTDQAPATEEIQEKAADDFLAGSPPEISTENIDAELATILSEMELEEEASEDDSAFDQFWNWLQQPLGRLNIGPGTGDNQWIVIGLIVLIAVLIALILWEILRRGRISSGTLEGIEFTEPDSFEKLMKLAKRALESGNYRNAIRFRFLAMLASMELHTATLLTNTQLMRIVRRSYPAATANMAPIVRTFEDVWYGGAAGSGSVYEKLDALAKDVEKSVRIVSEEENGKDGDEA